MINTRSDIDLISIKNLVSKGIFLDKEIFIKFINETTQEHILKIIAIYKKPGAIKENNELVKLVNDFYETYAAKKININKLKKLEKRLSDHLKTLSTAMKSDRASYWMSTFMLLHFLLATCQLTLGKIEEAQKNYEASFRMACVAQHEKFKLFALCGVTYVHLTDHGALHLLKAENFKQSYDMVLKVYANSSVVPEVFTVLGDMLDRKIKTSSKNNKSKQQAQFEIQKLSDQYKKWLQLMAQPGKKDGIAIGKMTEEIVKSEYFYFIDVVNFQSIQMFCNSLIIYKLSQCLNVKQHKRDAIQHEIADYLIAISNHVTPLTPFISQILDSIFFYKQPIFYSYFKGALDKIKTDKVFEEFYNSVYGGKDIDCFIAQTLLENQKRNIEYTFEKEEFIKEAIVLIKPVLMQVCDLISNNDIKIKCEHLITQFLDNVPENHQNLYDNCANLFASFIEANTFPEIKKHKPYLDILSYIISVSKIAMTKPKESSEISFLNDSLYLPTKEMEDHLRVLFAYLLTLIGSLGRAKYHLDKIPDNSPCANLKSKVYITINKFAEKPSVLNIKKSDEIEKILIELKKSILTGNYHETLEIQKRFEKTDQYRIYLFQDLDYSYLMTVFYLILRTEAFLEDKHIAGSSLMVHLAELTSLTPERVTSYFKFPDIISEIYPTDDEKQRNVLAEFYKDLEEFIKLDKEQLSLLFKKYISERTAPTLAKKVETDDKASASEEIITIENNERSEEESKEENVIADKENEICTEQENLRAIEKAKHDLEVIISKREAQMIAMEKIISKNEAELSKKEAEFRKRDEEILKRGAKLRQLENELHELIEIESLQTAITNKENEIRTEQKKLKSIEKRKQNLEVTLNKREKKMITLEDAISKNEVELSKREAEVRKRDEEIPKIEDEIHQTEELIRQEEELKIKTEEEERISNEYLMQLFSDEDDFKVLSMLNRKANDLGQHVVLHGGRAFNWYMHSLQDDESIALACKKKGNDIDLYINCIGADYEALRDELIKEPNCFTRIKEGPYFINLNKKLNNGRTLDLSLKIAPESQRKVVPVMCGEAFIMFTEGKHSPILIMNKENGYFNVFSQACQKRETYLGMPGVDTKNNLYISYKTKDYRGIIEFKNLPEFRGKLYDYYMEQLQHNYTTVYFELLNFFNHHLLNEHDKDALKSLRIPFHALFDFEKIKNEKTKTIDVDKFSKVDMNKFVKYFISCKDVLFSGSIQVFKEQIDLMISLYLQKDESYDLNNIRKKIENLKLLHFESREQADPEPQVAQTNINQPSHYLQQTQRHENYPQYSEVPHGYQSYGYQSNYQQQIYPPYMHHMHEGYPQYSQVPHGYQPYSYPSNYQQQIYPPHMHMHEGYPQYSQAPHGYQPYSYPSNYQQQIYPPYMQTPSDYQHEAPRRYTRRYLNEPIIQMPVIKPDIQLPKVELPIQMPVGQAQDLLQTTYEYQQKTLDITHEYQQRTLQATHDYQQKILKNFEQPIANTSNRFTERMNAANPSRGRGGNRYTGNRYTLYQRNPNLPSESTQQSLPNPNPKDTSDEYQKFRK